VVSSFSREIGTISSTSQDLEVSGAPNWVATYSFSHLYFYSWTPQGTINEQLERISEILFFSLKDILSVDR
jgi:hypothetical protein